VYVPLGIRVAGAAVELRMAADKNRDLPLNVLPHAQFSNPLPDGMEAFCKNPLPGSVSATGFLDSSGLPSTAPPINIISIRSTGG